jgi:predicted ATP-grasp superfamily ATP-dependent carboligase
VTAFSPPPQKRQTVLCEYLHADENAYTQASAGMRLEGRMMLTALLDDLLRVPQQNVAVALCPSAIRDLLPDDSQPVLPGTAPPAAHGLSLSTDSLTHLTANNLSHVHIIATAQQQPLTETLTAAQQYAGSDSHVLLIAPECDGLLIQLAAEFRRVGFKLILPDQHTIEICSDKHQTAQFLNQHGIPAVRTWTVEQAARQTAERCLVIKPRHGAGCDGIRRLTCDQFTEWQLHNSHRHDQFVVQPFTDGQSLSIAVIGCGSSRPPLILPLASQSIAWLDDSPVYQGGHIPAAVSPSVHQQALQLATRLASQLHLTTGYTGIDLLLDPTDNRLLVSEINPRLCTSYVGYRMHTDANLAQWLIHHPPDTAILWGSAPVTFGLPDQTRSSQSADC